MSVNVDAGRIEVLERLAVERFLNRRGPREGVSLHPKLRTCWIMEGVPRSHAINAGS